MRFKPNKIVKVYRIQPLPSGFGEYERTGVIAFISIDQLKERPDLDGLIREQNGMIPVEGCEIIGITRRLRRSPKH